MIDAVLHAEFIGVIVEMYLQFFFFAVIWNELKKMFWVKSTWMKKLGEDRYCRNSSTEVNCLQVSLIVFAVLPWRGKVDDGAPNVL